MLQSHPQYRAETFTIEPFSSMEIHRNAEFMVCLDASGTFQVAFDDAPKTYFEKGLSYEAQVAFNKMRIENPGDAAIGVTIGMGRGGIRDARFVVSGAVQTDTDAPAVLDTVDQLNAGAGVSTLIIGADVRRMETLVRNLSDTDDIWLRGDTSTTAGGVLLQPKEAAVLTSSAAIYAYNPNAGAVPVSALATRKEV